MLTFGCMAPHTNKQHNGKEIFEHLLTLVHSEEGQLCLSEDFQLNCNDLVYGPGNICLERIDKSGAKKPKAAIIV